MRITSQNDSDERTAAEVSVAGGLIPLLDRPAGGRPESLSGIVVGELLGIRDNCTPLVSYPKQPRTAAIAARTIVDLRAVHVGRQVVLIFEDGDPERPIVIGALRASDNVPFETRPGQIDVESDGARLIVSAKDELVLRCGDASITLTKEGKVLVQGRYVSSRSSGVNRIKGGTVEIN
jgi:Domain of unknown function (DUF6484)